MANKKRNSHSYKCTDSVYKKAMRRAKKDSTTLTEVIEEVVTWYSDGKDLKVEGGTGTEVKPLGK